MRCRRRIQRLLSKTTPLVDLRSKMFKGILASRTSPSFRRRRSIRLKVHGAAEFEKHHFSIPPLDAPVKRRFESGQDRREVVPLTVQRNGKRLQYIWKQNRLQAISPSEHKNDQMGLKKEKLPNRN